MTEENEKTSTDQAIAPPLMTHRVKFYQLNVDTNWEDKGTGNCIYQLGKDGHADQITVHSEEDNSIIMTTNILKRRLYQRQQDTLIVWTDDNNQDLALSFQDAEGCEEMWHCIQKKQGRIGDVNNDSMTLSSRSPPSFSLPDPELSNLPEISDLLTKALTMQEKDKLSAFILTERYIDKLIALFETCEDLEDISDLNLLYNVLVGIFQLNDQQIIDVLLQDEYFTNVMGILEYNPKTPGMKARHREFVNIHGHAKQVVKITDETISRKIDQTFRLEYLQGVFLHCEGGSDEGLMGVINSMIYQNHVDIINHVSNNHLLLAELFSAFKDPKTATEKKDDIIRFVHQLCNLTKTMQNTVRVNTLRALSSYGFFHLLRAALQHGNKTFRTNALNIIASFTDLDVTSVRSHILVQSDDDKLVGEPLMEIIVEQFVKDDDYDLKVQYFEILRLLLDPNGNTMPGPASSVNDPMSKQSPETDKFICKFYDKYTKTLLSPIESLEIKPMALTGPIEPLEMDSDQSQLCLYICDFLNFAMRSHGFGCKSVFERPHLYTKVAQLYRSKYSYIKLAALRFFRACITTDGYYHDILINQNIFGPTIRVLLDTDGQDNLLNSACLDLLDCIRRENFKKLIAYLVDTFGTVLDTITYIPKSRSLRLKHEQNVNAEEEAKQSSSIDSSEKLNEKKVDGWSSSTIDDEEEEYFNGSDEEDSSNIPKPVIPLVSYGEDDEDDEEEEQTPTKVLPSQEKENELKRTNQDDEIEANAPPFKTRRREEDDEYDIEDNLVKRIKESDEPVTTESEPAPQVFKSRKRSEQDEDEDDVLAKRVSPRLSPLASKKMVIKPPTMKKTLPRNR